MELVYARTPYGPRLARAGFVPILERKAAGWCVMEHAATLLTTAQCVAIMQCVKAMLDVGLRFATERTMFCFIVAADLEGIFLLEKNGSGWYRREFWDPIVDNPGLDFFDVTEHMRDVPLSK